MSVITGQRLETRKIAPSDLLPEEAVLTQGFAGHTIDQYPEPARSYNIAYARLHPVLSQMKTPIPLLVFVKQELVGVMNLVWSDRVGIVAVRRISPTQLEVVEEHVTYLTGDALHHLSFATDELLTQPPPWT